MNHRSKKINIYTIIICIYLISFFGCVASGLRNETNPSIPTGKILATTSPTPQDTPTVMELSVIPPTSTGLVSPPTIVTVPPKKLEEAVVDVETCKLPCVLGIHPGKTSWESVVRLIQGFGGYALEETVTRDGKQQDFITWHYPELSKSDVGGYVASENGVVTKIKVIIGQRQNHRYSIEQVLQTHGAPEQIMISTRNNGLKPTWGMYIFMLYPSQKFVVSPVLEASRQEDFVIGCKEFNSVVIFSYAEDIQWTEQMISELFFGAVGSFKIRPLSEVTTLDNESFYKLYMSEENTGRCIQTPSSVWN